MRHYFFLLAVFLLIFVSCGGSKTGTATDEEVADSVVARDTMSAVDSLLAELDNLPMPKAADELFDDFVFNFAANRNLQMERILFPLPVTRNGQTDSLDKKRWKTERFFLHQDYYTVLFDSERQMALMNDTSVHKATVEKIYFNTGAVIQYEFHRIRGAWMLTSVQTIPIAQNRNASFLDFYHQFVTDSVYQAESLHETVQFTGPDPDDDFAQMEGVITADTWPAFAPELPEKMIYNIVYGEPSKSTGVIIFMMRGIANGFEMMMTFQQQQNGRWVLTKMNT
jgi:hypothetical protein